MTAIVGDVLTVFVRQALPSWRSPAGLLFGMLQPLVFLAFFGPMLGGVGGMSGPDVTSSGDTWQWFVPAVLIMLALFGTTGSGYLLLTEMQTGPHERLLVTPINRTAMLAGRTLGDVVTLVAQALIVIVVMLPFGFDLQPVGALLGLLLLAVLGVAVGTLSHALAIVCRKHPDVFYMVQQTLLFPLLFLSGLMLPLDFGPTWLQVLGRLNPLTYVVDAVRDLFGGSIATAAVLQGATVTGVLVVVGLAAGTRAMRRTTG